MKPSIAAAMLLAAFSTANAHADEPAPTFRLKDSGAAVAVRTKGLTRDAYLDRMAQHWDQLNKNNDSYLEWQGAVPKEPLSNALKSCVVVKYELTPAVVNQKDPKNPGVLINEPAKVTPVDWLFFTEIFETMTTPTNECLSFDQTQTPYCIVNKQKTTYPKWVEAGAKGKASPLTGCFGWTSSWGILQKDCTTAGFAKWCTAQKGLYGVTNGEGHCAEYASYGAEVKESFLAAADVAFAAEDYDKNGLIDAGEGRWLCQPWNSERKKQ